MGIRFLCYHCEKRLNVKENQAGQQGRCPNCLGIVEIPDKSTILSTSEKQNKHDRLARRSRAKSDSFVGLHSVDDQVTLDGLSAEDQHAKQTSLSTKNKPAARKTDLSESSSTEMFLLAKPELPASIGKVDPIAEAPKSVWYFRSRDLGEKGPLKGKAMQEYVDQGDVKIGCIVWREDWNDWVPAEKAFPSLVAEAKSKRNKQKKHRAFKDADYQIPDELNPHSERFKKQRKRAWIFRSLIASAILIISGLIYVMIQLLFQ